MVDKSSEYIEVNLYQIGWRKILRYFCLAVSWCALVSVFFGLPKNSAQLEIAKILTICPGIVFLYLQVLSSSGLFKIKTYRERIKIMEGFRGFRVKPDDCGMSYFTTGQDKEYLGITKRFEFIVHAIDDQEAHQFTKHALGSIPYEIEEVFYKKSQKNREGN